MSPTVSSTVGLAAEVLRISGIYLQPYMPNKAKQILDYLGVENSKREWQNAKIGSDSTYGNPLVPLGEGHEGVLFPPIPEA
jgi:methionyl-tRNA synthetase